MNTKYKSTAFACYRGYITQAIIVNLTPLFFVIFQEQYNVSFVMLGNIVLLNFVTQLLTDAASIGFIGKIGYRAAALIAHALAALGLILLGVMPLYLPLVPSVFVATFIFAVGGGLLEVIVSPIIDSIPGEAKESSMSLLHSFYCWGQVGVILITTLILKCVGNRMWNIIPVLWAAIPIYNLIAFLKVPIRPPVPESKRTPIRMLLKSKVFLVVLLLMTCSGAAELGVSQWSSLFTEKALGVPKTVGDIFGPCLFGITMGIGRTVYGIYGHKIRMSHVLFISALLSVISYLMIALCENVVLSFLGCALCGLSVSIMWPGVLSIAAATFTSGGAAMFGMMALFGDIGCSLGPWFIGLISGTAGKGESFSSLRMGILVAAIFPVIMLLGIICFNLKRKKTN